MSTKTETQLLNRINRMDANISKLRTVIQKQKVEIQDLKETGKKWERLTQAIQDGTVRMQTRIEK